MGARGRVWMRVCAGFASGECRGKAACRRVFDGAMTLNVFVIFRRFESQREWNSSRLYTPTLIEPQNDKLVERHREPL